MAKRLAAIAFTVALGLHGCGDKTETDLESQIHKAVADVWEQVKDGKKEAKTPKHLSFILLAACHASTDSEVVTANMKAVLKGVLALPACLKAVATMEAEDPSMEFVDETSWTPSFAAVVASITNECETLEQMAKVKKAAANSETS